jgi:hypothetical protein
MSTEIHSTVSSKGEVVISADVRRLKGRVAAPAKPVSLDEMAATIDQRRAVTPVPIASASASRGLKQHP